MLYVRLRALTVLALSAMIAALCLAAPVSAQDASCSRLVIQERRTGKKLQIFIVDRQGDEEAVDEGKAKKAKNGKKQTRRVFITRNAQVPPDFYENIRYRNDEEIELLLNPPQPPERTPCGEIRAFSLKDLGDAGRDNYFIRKALQAPGDWVTIDGFRCRALTAAHWTVLRGYIAERFPGRGILITSTVDGRHMSDRHPDGRAIDFCVSPLSREESIILEDLCRRAGFEPFNEYIHDSPYKTGDHMHISL
jgi:hypothetical protein